MDWKLELEEVLSGIKYCFTPQNGKYPEIDGDSFYGKEESGVRGAGNFKAGEAGFLDLMISVVDGMRRRAFVAGYKRGGSDVCGELNETWDESVSEIGASRGWEEFNTDRGSDV